MLSVMLCMHRFTHKYTQRGHSKNDAGLARISFNCEQNIKEESLIEI